MKILFCGDVVGSSGRKVLRAFLPTLKETLDLDFIVVNAENAAHGFGLTPKMYKTLKELGIHVMTMGNHTWDKKDIVDVLQNEVDIVRPLNYPEGTIGRGFCVYTLPDGRKAAVAQVLGQVFMRDVDNPFQALKQITDKYTLGRDYQAFIVDIHGEATSEKMAMGFFMDGKASLVAGTHTHIPTADAMILPKGTGYITDIGMCGDYYSIIGMQVETAMPRFVNKAAKTRLQPAEKEGTLCAVYLETDDETGLCRTIRPVRLGAHLIATR